MAKYWSFSFSISPSNEYSGLISFSIDWLDLFVVQGTLKSLIQHHGSKPSIVHYSPFFMLQMSYPYMTSGNIIALIILNFFSIVTTLLLKMLHDLLSFLQTSKHHLISWLQSSSAVILEPPKIKSDAIYTVSPSISHEVMGPDAMILVFRMLSFKPT